MTHCVAHTFQQLEAVYNYIISGDIRRGDLNPIRVWSIFMGKGWSEMWGGGQMTKWNYWNYGSWFSAEMKITTSLNLRVTELNSPFYPLSTLWAHISTPLGGSLHEQRVLSRSLASKISIKMLENKSWKQNGEKHTLKNLCFGMKKVILMSTLALKCSPNFAKK